MRGAIYQLPSSMANAVRLMYAGAAFALVYAVGTILVVDPRIVHHPVASRHASLGALVALTVFFSIIQIAVWLMIARACKNRRKWARVTGTVLFGFHTLATLGVLASSSPGIGVAKILTPVSWLIACGAVVFLWQRPSSAFFRGQTSISR
jgi:hypothetical protein